MNSPLFSPDDPRLTAFALGELSGDDRAEVEVALRLDPALRQQVDELRAFTQQLQTAFTHDAANAGAGAERMSPDGLDTPSLTPPPEQPALRRSWRWHSRRARPRRIEIVAEKDPSAPVLEAYPIPRRRTRLLQFPQVYFVIAGAAAAGFAVLVAFRDNTLRPAAPVASERLWRREIALGLPDAQVASVTPASSELSLAASMLPPATDAAPVTAASKSPAAAARDAGFIHTAGAPVSVPAFEIETVGYGEIRQWLERGMLPPPETVRVESLLNHLPVPIPVPSGETFAASLEVATAPWAPEHKLVRIGIKARDAGPRPPANLVFVLDVSASMRATNKLPLVKEALRRFIARLRPDDRVAVVTDSANAGIVLPSTPVAEAKKILAAIEGINVASDATIRAGIERAYAMMETRLERDLSNRVIVFTDGDPTLAAAESELSHVIEQRAPNAALDVMGLGHDERRDTVLERLAKQGGGVFGAVERGRDVETLLAEQVEGDDGVVAKDVSVEVDFNPAAVAQYRLIGYETSVASTAGVAAKGDEGSRDVVAGDEMLALYEVVPASGAELSSAPAATMATAPRPTRAGTSGGVREFRAGKVAAGGAEAPRQELLRLTLRYTDPARHDAARKDAIFPLLDRDAAFPEASREFRFAAAVAEFGMILRQSPHRGNATLAEVRAWALGASAADDPFGVHGEIVEWMRKAQSLSE